MTNETKYVALVPLMFPNPGQTPSVMKVKPGDIFSLDGSEGLRADRLLRSQAIKLYDPGPRSKQKRGKSNAK